MYCSACGQLLEPNQPVCRRCGKPAAGVPAPLQAPPFRTGCIRVHKHLQTLGVLWIVYAGWSVLQVIVAATILTGMSGMFGNHWGMNPGLFWDRFPFFNAPWLVTVITVLTVARAILSAATGVCLLMKVRSGRILAIVAAVLTVIKPILGTALAIYTFWVLAPRNSAVEYEEISLAAQ